LITAINLEELLSLFFNNEIFSLNILGSIINSEFIEVIQMIRKNCR